MPANILLIYLAVVNLVGFSAMGIDKKKAIRNAWRIPEARLFLYAFLGGGIGTTFGMRLFRHKTKHWYFVLGMPLIAVIEYGVLIYFFIRQ